MISAEILGISWNVTKRPGTLRTLQFSRLHLLIVTHMEDPPPPNSNNKQTNEQKQACTTAPDT